MTTTTDTRGRHDMNRMTDTATDNLSRLYSTWAMVDPDDTKFCGYHSLTAMQDKAIVPMVASTGLTGVTRAERAALMWAQRDLSTMR